MSPGVTVLNQIHRKSQDSDVNAGESGAGEKRAAVCVCGGRMCAPIRLILCLCGSALMSEHARSRTQRVHAHMHEHMHTHYN